MFDDPRWPQAVREHRDTLLKDGYARAREMLKPNPYPNSAPNLPKLDANKKSADYLKQGAHFYKPPINVTFDKLPNNLNHVGVEQLPCNQCGDCVSGCNNKAKNTTLMNYLPDAWNHGAEISARPKCVIWSAPAMAGSCTSSTSTVGARNSTHRRCS